jgi:hypothetical protein
VTAKSKHLPHNPTKRTPLPEKQAGGHCGPPAETFRVLSPIRRTGRQENKTMSTAKYQPSTHKSSNSPAQQYDNSGILFRNEDKDPNNDRDRDYGGEATIAGVAYWVSGWIKQGKRGKFMTFSFRPKEESVGATKKQAGGGVPFDDDVPFAPK